MANEKFSIYVPEFRTPVEPQREILDPVAKVISERAKNEADLIAIISRVDAVLLTLNTQMTRLIRNIWLTRRFSPAAANKPTQQPLGKEERDAEDRDSR